ncbi:Nramp family divalent metal transporter [Streptomyces sp. NBC_00056]|uniref:Nramp family divalent metal transporter n=1 Tax=Streptomyces sp. NBC_00056 TaxID=2975633 RepID=UPI0032539E47
MGTATGRNLPELCRERYPRPVVWGLWLQAEAVIVMTDLAELIGGAIALNLLFGLPLLPGALLVTMASFLLLAVRSARTRHFGAALTVMLVAVAGAFLVLVLQAQFMAGSSVGMSRSLCSSRTRNAWPGRWLKAFTMAW